MCVVSCDTDWKIYHCIMAKVIKHMCNKLYRYRKLICKSTSK